MEDETDESIADWHPLNLDSHEPANEPLSSWGGSFRSILHCGGAQSDGLNESDLRSISFSGRLE